MVLAALLSLAFVIWKKQTNNTAQGTKLQVSTSFYPLFYFAKVIGGEKANVVNITPAGAEPHDYEPTAQDVVHMEQSRIIITNGNGLEPWSKNIQDLIDPNATLFVTAGEGLASEKMNEDGNEVLDPHVWLSPALAIRMVETIASAYQTVDPENIPYYHTNAAALKNELEQLDDKFTSGLTSCETRDFITSHAAFGYLAKEFNLHQLAITGISPESEPTQQSLRDIADFARKNNIKYIFFESLLSPKLSETLATEVGASTLVLNPLEGLTDQEIRDGKDYITVMEENLAHLRIALACTQ